MTLTGALGVLMSVARPAWLALLAKCGTVCGINGAAVLFESASSGGGTFTEFSPFMLSIPLRVLAFPPSSVTAACITLLVALEVDKLTAPKEAVERAWCGRPIPASANLGLCCATLFVGPAADFAVFDSLSLSSGLIGAIVRLVDTFVDLSPADG